MNNNEIKVNTYEEMDNMLVKCAKQCGIIKNVIKEGKFKVFLKEVDMNKVNW